MTHCCEMMSAQIAHHCEDHDPWECPDRLVIRVTDNDGRGYGLIIHDGGSSFIRISYCPWCGQDLKTSPLGQVDKASFSDKLL